jgi:hypothetical protein
VTRLSFYAFPPTIPQGPPEHNTALLIIYFDIRCYFNYLKLHDVSTDFHELFSVFFCSKFSCHGTERYTLGRPWQGFEEGSVSFFRALKHRNSFQSYENMPLLHFCCSRECTFISSSAVPGQRSSVLRVFQTECHVSSNTTSHQSQWHILLKLEPTRADV